MTFTYAHRVRSYEVDHQGIVFNGRYLELADAAMTEFFDGFGWTYPQLIALGFDPAVVAIDLRFRAPARLGDDLVVTVTCTHVGTTSTVLHFVVRRGEHDLASITTTYVNVTSGVGRSAPIPQPIRERLVAIAQHQGESS
ncbi:acyl-CoA thioesterase [Microbacterium sp.]|uniref:acyl-CoA thioesterase n=1 Tax=Microbacterium sp. TaxID=51671 RepID=UPI002811B866|nr:thioesterase family protein [Microbacterium sp.]